MSDPSDITQQETQLAATVAETAAFALSGPQLAALVSAAAALVLQIEAIRANAVQAWSQVETDFTAAADAWNQASETPIAQAAIANADPAHFNDARLSGQQAPAPVAIPSPTSGLSTVTVSLGGGVSQQPG